MSDTSRFAISRVYASNYTDDYKEELILPLNLCNLRESLARSLFLTLYKPRNAYVFISLLGNLDNSLIDSYEKEFDIIDDCQTIFANCVKDLPCSVYTIGNVWIVPDSLTYVGNNNFNEVDKLYVSEESKAAFKEQLEKAAIIVEGFLQYLTVGEFTEECLALVDDYRATKMLEG